MQLKNYDPRILAIDLRPQRFGYGVFEGSKRLLDWGANACPPGGEAGATVAARRVGVLIKLFHPSAIVVRKDHRRKALNGPGVEPILKSLRREAGARSIPLHLMGSDDISRAFRLFRATTKYEMSVALTGIFPELVWKLPHKRKTWEPEPHVMAVFGAVALGFAYLERRQSWAAEPD
jgi:hypothetical protein